MDNILLSPAEYDRWYYTEKGKYISGFEKRILLKMINPPSPPFSKGGLGGILDIGCGTGYFTQFFGGLCRNTVGVDTSMDMIKYAMKKIEARSQRSEARIKYIVADAEYLPFK
ncbi:MAG: class I SAM-dependent methyltransferase, partial [Nitrospinae bacterium]|nr:class I SAM-dependent methyltransferase [Nitrospinota bacterium]